MESSYNLKTQHITTLRNRGQGRAIAGWAGLLLQDRHFTSDSQLVKSPVGVEKVTVISDRNDGRSMVIRRRNACHAVDRHSRRPADHDGTARSLGSIIPLISLGRSGS